MEQKTEIKNLQELIDWIDNIRICCIEETDEDYFVVEAPNNATCQIQFDKNDGIDDIISKTVQQLEEFDADERFMDFWSKEFAKHNQFKPSQFITMMQEDDASLRELSYKLKELKS